MDQSPSLNEGFEIYPVTRRWYLDSIGILASKVKLIDLLYHGTIIPYVSNRKEMFISSRMKDPISYNLPNIPSYFEIMTCQEIELLSP